MNNKNKIKTIRLQSVILMIPSALGMFLLGCIFIRDNENPNYLVLAMSIFLYVLFALVSLQILNVVLSKKMIKQNALYQVLVQLNHDQNVVKKGLLNPVTKGEKRVNKLIESFHYYKQANLLMSRDLLYLKEEAALIEKKNAEIKEEHQRLSDQLEAQKKDNQCLMEMALEAIVTFNKNEERVYTNPRFDRDYENEKADYVFSSDSYRVEMYKNDQAHLKNLVGEIKVKSKELSYIKQTNDDLITSKSIQEISDRMLQNIDEMYGIDSATIYDYEPSNEVKWLKRSVNNRPLLENSIDRIDPLIHLDSDWENHPCSMFKVVTFNEEEKGTLYIYPIEIEGKLTSIYCILLNKRLSSSEENMFKVFGNQMAIVIQRAVMYQALRNQYFNTIETLVNVIEAKDKYTEGHSRRVSRFAVEIAKKMGYSNEEIEDVEIAGLLHDVGKIGVDYSILVKNGKLTDEEFEKMKAHPEKAIQILNAIELNQNIIEGILYHHLRYDLSGYPRVQIKEMPEFAAIIGAADAFDAITSARSYSQAKTINEALIELNRYKGTQFSPKMVELFEEIATHSREKIQDIINDLDVSKRDFKGEFNVISSTL